MSAFSVRPYEPGDEEGIVALFNAVFSEDNPSFEPRTLDDWRAIYLDNPAGIQTFVATNPEGEVIGNYSAIPAWCSDRGERAMSMQAVDTCVDKRYRGRLSKKSVFVTIATEMISYYSTPGRDPYDVYMWGLPNEQAFPVGTRIIGYKPVHCPMPALVADVDEAWVAAREAEAGDVTTVDWDGASDDVAGTGATPGDVVAGLAGLFERHLDRDAITLWKDEAYIAWRYRATRQVTYRVALAQRGGELVGAAVYRLGWGGMPVVPIVDWYGDGADRAVQAALLARIARTTREHGGARLETWATPPTDHFKTLSTLGLSREDSRFNLCIMTFGEGLSPEMAKEHWAVTMGDSDIY